MKAVAKYQLKPCPHCRRKVRLISATVAVFCDSLTFLRQCGQGFILLGKQRHIGVNNLPKVVARQCRGRELNPRPPDHESNTLATTPPSHPSCMPMIIRPNHNRIMFMVLSSWLCSRVIARVHPVYAMNAEQRQTAADLWTKPTDLSRRSACRQHVTTTSTNRIIHYISRTRAGQCQWSTRIMHLQWPANSGSHWCYVLL